MSKEIEHKYLVKSDKWRKAAKGEIYRQGYLSSIKERIVKIRTIGDKGFLTVKGIRTGTSRTEFEYEIPFVEAERMLNDLCEQPLIEKKRYKINFKGMLWEIDEFFGDNKGLILAEVELKFENQIIKLPDWIGEEVTEDNRYYNSNLISNPFKNWN